MTFFSPANTRCSALCVPSVTITLSSKLHSIAVCQTPDTSFIPNPDISPSSSASIHQTFELCECTLQNKWISSAWLSIVIWTVSFSRKCVIVPPADAGLLVWWPAHHAFSSEGPENCQVTAVGKYLSASMYSENFIEQVNSLSGRIMNGEVGKQQSLGSGTV